MRLLAQLPPQRSGQGRRQGDRADGAVLPGVVRLVAEVQPLAVVEGRQQGRPGEVRRLRRRGEHRVGAGLYVLVQGGPQGVLPVPERRG